MGKSHPAKPQTDAGRRSVDHCELLPTPGDLITYSKPDTLRLPHWRRVLRDAMLPLVRWETPVLARIQARCRSPAWDAYFAYTAILGTHTFYMIGLPVLNWFGSPMFRAYVSH